MSTIPYQKPALDIDAQLNLLEQRGMILEDRARAEHYLRFIGYYRLSGYWFPFQYRDDGPDHDNFRPGTEFERVLDRYVFDRRLRLLIMDAAVATRFSGTPNHRTHQQHQRLPLHHL
ncbi:Abi family protein [Pseudovibrio exalbescens]|uniref:Abi family protein n=1 Tax=Pseudovibrio exalbescens TaxID=197461 RepID=UPI0023672E19|nr:Abi family protein [Pseudovibrio exalbescens]MDD7911970.1 Abi family protein [Pseudovibrio exalbescens]